MTTVTTLFTTSQLPDGNRASDAELCELADRESRIVVTKDNDFRASHLLRRTPRQLLLVTTGNITNDALLALVDRNLSVIVDALTEARFVELTATPFIVRENR